MSSKNPISYLTIRVFSHATEDPEKVQTAIRNTLPEQAALSLVVTKTSLTGHHGNPIILHEVKITEKHDLIATLEKIASSPSSLDKEAFSAEVNQHIEKGNLYLRFDKQSAFQGVLKLGSVDAIHFKIHFKNLTLQELTEFCRKAGLLL